MGSGGIVVLAPLFDDDLRLLERVEDFAIEQFITQSGIEALAIAILPGTTRHDVGGPGANGSDPVPDSLGDELGAIV